MKKKNWMLLGTQIIIFTAVFYIVSYLMDSCFNYPFSPLAAGVSGGIVSMIWQVLVNDKLKNNDKGNSNE